MGNWGHFTPINLLLIDGQLGSFHPYKSRDRWATGVISPLNITNQKGKVNIGVVSKT